MKKRLESIVCIILICLLIFVIYLKFIKKVENIKLFGYSFFIVKTGSMEPNISIGELIIVKEKNKYDIGKIVTYYDGDIFITHRIVDKVDESYIIKGDKNNEQDEIVFKENIVGEVVLNSMILGNFITEYLKVIIIWYVLIIISLKIFDILKEKEKNEKI